MKCGVFGRVGEWPVACRPSLFSPVVYSARSLLICPREGCKHPCFYHGLCSVGHISVPARNWAWGIPCAPRAPLDSRAGGAPPLAKTAAAKGPYAPSPVGTLRTGRCDTVAITTVLAEDHHIVREGLRVLLAAQSDIEVVGEAGDGVEAIRIVERVKPCVLVLDLGMPGIHGLEVIRQVRERSPLTRVVILSMHSREAYVTEALRAGATAYVLKDATPDQLIHAIREAAQGRRFLSPSLAQRAIEAYAERGTSPELDLYESLSGREREVLHLAAEGLTNAQTGARLFISPRTVEIHRANMMRKLGLRTQVDLVRYAIRRGILAAEVEDAAGDPKAREDDH
ncbi:MAG: response regulator transcription factor [Armatimonadetes bacterium]|nr:response regulator transcription factor [Armatimonadota bacterium]